MVDLLILPFAACVVIAALHCYMGLHVIKRGVIFVDLALAQCAALGASVALFVLPLVGAESGHPAGPSGLTATEAELAEQLDRDDWAEPAPVELQDDEDHAAGERDGPHHHDATQGREAWLTYGMSVLFAMLGAVILSVARFRDNRIGHEAIIGTIFVVAASLSVLILSKAPHGHEKLEAMLVGSILFVSWPQVWRMLLLYLALGAFHVAFRRRFIHISRDVVEADRSGVRVRLWDCLFYGSFALMVTQSVGIAGVFVVFSFLIIPALCAALFSDRFGRQVVIAWAVALAASLAGLFVSAAGDLPTGSSLVSCFGAALVICALMRRGARPTRGGVQ